MITTSQIIAATKLQCTPYPNWPKSGVLVTPANQLIGTKQDLDKFKPAAPAYRGWQAHHIVEDHDLKRLGIEQKFPVYKEQTCVLIPREAHLVRVNSILRYENPVPLS